MAGQGIATLYKRVKQSAIAVPGSTGSALARRVTIELNLERDQYENPEIVSHQQSTGATAGVAKTTGKWNGILSPGTFSSELGSLLRKDFAATAAMATVSLTIGAATLGVYPLTRAAGSWLTDGLKVGDIIRLSVGTLNAANIAKNLMVVDITSATAAKVIPVNGVALVAEGPITGCTVTVIGKKSFVPKTGHTNDYYTWEKWYPDVGAGKSELFTDVKPASADITLPPTGNSTIVIDLPGLGRTRGATEILTSAAAETTTPVLTSVQGKILVGGVVTPVTGLQFKIDGGIQPGEPEVGSNAISDHQKGRIKISGQFTAKFTATTFQDIFDNQTPTSLIGMAADSASATADFITFVMSRVKLFSDGADDGEKEIIRTYSFTAEINGAGGPALANDATIISIQDSQAA